MTACSHTGGFPGRPCPWCGTLVPEIATVECPPTPVAVVGGEASGPGAASLPPATLFAPDDAAQSGAPGARGGGEARPPGPTPAALIVPVVAVHGNGTGGPPSAFPATGAPSHKGARNTDPDTSLAAARSITDMRRRADHDLVLALLHKHGPLTDFDLARLASFELGHMVKSVSIGKRRGELRDAGVVADSGQRGRSDTGTSAICWALTAAGEREVIGGAA